jgi:hypothetical protein
MAFVATLTGTARSINATNGSPNVTVTNTAGFVVGATVQGTGWAAGTRIVSFVANTSAVFSNNFTGTTGATNVIVSSVSGSILTIELTASGDVATWQNVFNAGFGVLQGTKSLLYHGALIVRFGSIVSGARFDHQDWTVEFGDGGRVQFDSGLLAGEQRGGYDVAGSLLVKAAGPTFVFNPGADAPLGGYSLFLNTGNLLTQGGLFRMHNPRFIVRAGTASNRSPAFTSVRDNMDVENMVLDYSEATGTNAGIGCGFGTILNPKIIQANSSLTRTNANSFGNVVGLQFLGIFTDSPNAKFAIPNNTTMEGYAPLVTNAQSIGGFQDNTTETFANIDLTTPGWGLSDLTTKYQRYGGPNTINFPRRVTFEINDGAGANLTDTTLFIRSGATTVVNAVQAGDYSANTQALVLQWTGSVASYRVANTITNTINQTAQFRKNGYISQTVSYSLNNAAYSQPMFLLLDPAYGSVTPAQAAALTGLSLDYANSLYTVSAARNLDQIYAFGQFSQALTANSAQPDFQTSVAGRYSLTSPWRMAVTAGALTMGTYNNTFSSSTAWTFSGTSSLNLDRDEVVWTPSAYANQLFFASGGTFNMSNNSTLTVNPTANFGYVTPPMFGQNVTSNISNSVVTYNLNASHSGNIFGADINSTASGVPTVTVNYSNFTLTVNGTSVIFADVGCFWTQTSTINNWTINGTAASSVRLQVGVASQQLNGLTMAGTLLGSNAAANGRVMYMNNFTYSGTQSVLPNSQGGFPRWFFVDPVRTDGAVFRWGAGTAPASTQGFNAVLGFRPSIRTEKTGYTPKLRITPSALASRYPVRIIDTTADSTIPLSNFYRDTVFMAASDGFLPFVDSLDDKTVLTNIDWALNFRQPGWLDQSVSFLASTAKTGLITYNASGAVDSNYVNASTAVADAALITVNTSTKTIAPVSGTITWSPQRLYNALKQWWSTFASNTDFLAATANGVLNLGDYNTASGLRFGVPASGDALTQVRTTGLINAATNDISVTDANGTSTLWEFQSVAVGSSLVIYDASGVTKYFQQEVTTAGDYSYYIPSGVTGTYTWAIERYGFQRQSGNFAANTGGLLFYVPIYVEDVGISQTNKTTVAAYTAIDTLDKFYDFTAYRRLFEDFIKLGQIATRSGTAVEIGNYNLKVNVGASVMESITGNTITIKSGSLASGSKYNTIIATPPRTVTPQTTEVITANIEDGNGNSSVTIQGGSGNFTLWKLLNSVPDDDYATGTNLGNVGNVTYRFLSDPGYKIVIRDNTTAYRINCPMDKGIYTRGLFFGDQVQLAQAAEVTQINTKVDILTNNVNALPTTIMNTTVETGATVVESLRLHNSVLGGKVSGGGSGVETFRDLADTKDRLVSTNTATGDRSSEVYDLT